MHYILDISIMKKYLTYSAQFQNITLRKDMDKKAGILQTKRRDKKVTKTDILTFINPHFLLFP